LAAEDAAKEVPYFNGYKEIVKSIYAFFSNSYKRMYELKAIQEDSENPDLAILNIVDTRWLSWTMVIHNFHQILDDIHLALIQQKDTNSMANFLHQALTTEFYIFTKFLADILTTMRSMILVFQSDYVSLTETRQQLSMAIESITSDFIGNDNSTPHYGVHLANYMNECNLTGEDLPSKSSLILFKYLKKNLFYFFLKKWSISAG
jgi:hypothetical protein